MSLNTQARFHAVRDATSRQPRVVQRPSGGVTENFGRNTFSLEVMADRLPRPIFKRLKAVIDGDATMDLQVADAVAQAVKAWAIEHGASHFTHWFQPMTGLTAEKHDAFLHIARDGRAVERLSGSALVQGEPDASSFPSGGMRTTFEARGYTGWDPSSPMFIMETDNGATLCIPSVFISYHGEALDKKTPLLRSMDAINREARGLLARIGAAPSRVVPTLGCEQEYFLLDRAYYALRPDLAIAGRTLVGAEAPKGQSLDDHYFGAIAPRVQAFMQEVEQELYKLGVPAKTRHNEVAPSQFEIAPIFDEANVAVDHNQLTMEILRKVAKRHDFEVLLHEKPYARVNGSGKHNNWSLDADGENLLDPGETPSENLRFITVLASVLLGVHRYAGLLRAAIASHGNDFRLGANEAPPAIISVFLGKTLTGIVDGLLAGGDLPSDASAALLDLGVSRLPDLVKDNTDRNRTSPMAFTGNKFEFRAVGSKQSPSFPITVLNTAVADAMRQISAWIDEAGGGEAGAIQAIRHALKLSDAVRFDGNGYSEEWVEEAERRGLPHLRKTPEALAQLNTDDARALFERHSVLSAAELEARYNVWVEQYITAVSIEMDLLQEITQTMVLPAVTDERTRLAGAAAAIQALGAPGVVDNRSEIERLGALNQHLRALSAARLQLTEAAQAAGHDPAKWASAVAPAIDAVRASVDALEGMVADGAWPLPKYREMLFLQ